MHKYFAYVRVSTVRQGEHGVSLNEQRAAINRYAKGHGLQITEWFEEHITAAKSGRPVFGRMLKLLRKRAAEGLIIHTIDRGVRNLWDWASLGELLDEGIDVRFVRENVDLQVRGGRLSADIQAVVAADYVRNLREETLKGFYGRLKQGYYPLKAPVGYVDNGSGRLKTICPMKGPLVRRAFELYASGNLTLSMLAEEIFHLGLKNRRGAKFSENGISAILNNPFYIGLIRIKNTKQIFPGKHEPLVSKALFDRVQDVLRGRTQKQVRNHDFLFRGLFTCRACGKNLVGERQRGHVYYRCHTKGCYVSCVSEEALSAEIKKTLANMQVSTGRAKTIAQEALHQSQAQSENRRRQIESLRAELETVKRRLARLTDVFQEGLVDKHEYWERRNTAHLRQLDLQQKIDTLESKRQNERTAVYSFEDGKTVYDVYQAGSKQDKRELLQALFAERVVQGRRVYLALAERVQVWQSAGRPPRFINLILLLLRIENLKILAPLTGYYMSATESVKAGRVARTEDPLGLRRCLLHTMPRPPNWMAATHRNECPRSTVSRDLLVPKYALEQDAVEQLLSALFYPSLTNVEDIDYRHPRGLDKSLMLSLAGCDWVRQHHNVIITGPTGAGKSYLACALGNKACREGYRVLYFRIARLFQDLAIAKADGRYDKLLRTLVRSSQLLVLDDWGTAPLTHLLQLQNLMNSPART